MHLSSAHTLANFYPSTLTTPGLLPMSFDVSSLAVCCPQVHLDLVRLYRNRCNQEMSRLQHTLKTLQLEIHKQEGAHHREETMAKLTKDLHEKEAWPPSLPLPPPDRKLCRNKLVLWCAIYGAPSPSRA